MVERRSSNAINSDYVYNVFMGLGLAPLVFLILSAILLVVGLVLYVVRGRNQQQQQQGLRADEEGKEKKKPAGADSYSPATSSNAKEGSSSEESQSATFTAHFTVLSVAAFLFALSMTLLFAFTSAFEMLHLAPSILLMVFVVVLCSFAMSVAMDQRSAALEQATSSTGLEPHFDSPARAEGDGNGKKSVSDSAIVKKDAPGAVGGRSWYLAPKRHPFCCVIPIVVLVLVYTIALLITFGLCFCNQPYEWSGLVARSAETRQCPENDVCVSYFTLGSNCTTTTLVSHLISDGSASTRYYNIPWISSVRAKVSIALEDQATTTTASNTNTILFAGTVVDMSQQIKEDPRWVVHVPLSFDLLHQSPAGLGYLMQNALSNDTGLVYAIELSIALSTGVTLQRSLTYQSVPCSLANRSDAKISFVGGGDYNIGGVGKARITDALVQYPNASFVYLGGDLAYANNFRRCYRRWDAFLIEVSEIVHSPVNPGAHLPFLTAVGNHEGGGYLHATTPSERREVYHFYTTFFPHQSRTLPYTNSAKSASSFATTNYRVLVYDSMTGTYTNSFLDPSVVDDTLTFHDHSVGGGILHLVVTDTDIMVAASEQTEFLRESLNSSNIGGGFGLGNAGQGGTVLERPTVMPIYHNPAYPARRDPDEITAEVKTHFESLLHQYRASIPFVLEHHDHVYKRTIPLVDNDGTGNSSVTTSTTTNGNASSVVVSRDDGLRFLGDGALGAWKESYQPQTDRAYLEQAAGANYYLGIELTLGSSTCTTAAGSLLSSPSSPSLYSVPENMPLVGASCGVFTQLTAHGSQQEEDSASIVDILVVKP